MKTAMILAAGRGERMRPLTDNMPKPLLPAGGRPLLEYHLENLAAAGVERIVINHARHGDMIAARYGDGHAFGAEIVYSPEGDDPLETGGGIKQALPLLGPGPFIVVNADIWTDFNYAGLAATPHGLAHLVLVPNPGHNQEGDFALVNGIVSAQGTPKFTYSGIGLYRPELLVSCHQDIFPLAPLLRSAADRGELTGELHWGRWVDVGTPERLQQLDMMLRGGV